MVALFKGNLHGAKIHEMSQKSYIDYITHLFVRNIPALWSSSF